MTTLTKKISQAADDADFNENFNSIKQAFTDAAVGVKNKTSDLMTESLEEVKARTIKKPLKSLGIALLTGAVLGFLIKR